MTSRIGNEASLSDNVPKLGIGGVLSKREPLKYLCNHVIFALFFPFFKPTHCTLWNKWRRQKRNQYFYYYHVLLIYSKTFHTQTYNSMWSFLFMILVYSNFKMHVLVFYKNVKYNNNFFLQNWIPKMVINIAHTAFDTPLLFTAAAKIEFLRYIAHA